MSIQENESYVKNYTNKVLNNLAKAPEGDRNNSLRDAAFTFGGLIAAGHLGRTEAEELLYHTGIAIGLSEKETAATLQGGLDAGGLLPLELEGAESSNPLSPEKKAAIEKKRQATLAAKQSEMRAALQKLQTDRPDLAYHKNLNGQAAYLKKNWGLTDFTIDQFKVGYCQACPTSTYSDSFTIPYYWQNKLINLRHRLNHPNGSGKYRPELVGLPSAIFNADILSDPNYNDEIIIVEGEFKAMILWQYGLPAVGIPGAGNFKEKWAGLFGEVKRVYIALDPDAEKQALRIGRILKKSRVKVRLITLPVKPDDFFILYGGDFAQFCRFLEAGRVL